MENIRLPEGLVKHLLELRDLFTAPTFEYIQVIISGLLLGNQRRRSQRRCVWRLPDVGSVH